MVAAAGGRWRGVMGAVWGVLFRRVPRDFLLEPVDIPQTARPEGGEHYRRDVAFVSLALAPMFAGLAYVIYLWVTQ